MEKDCEECEKPVDLKAGDEISPEIGTIALDYGEVEICRSCFMQGWSKLTPQDLINDPEFGKHISISSPIQIEDL